MSKSLIEVIRHSEQQNELWQWDTGRQIIITPEKNAIVDEVHFSNAYSKDALVVKPQVNEQGNIVADIPNILLWQVFPINVYVVMEFPNGKGTIYEEQLKINPRKKPSDYVYTETEILNYLDLEKRIKALEESGTGGGIAKETDPTVPQWAKEPTKPKYTADEVGAPTKEEFNNLSEDVSKLSEDIADLKENGTGTGSGTAVQSIEPAEDDIPKVFIDGEIPTNKTDVLAELMYVSKTDNFHAYLEIKCQGDSSMSYPKKNFTIKMFSDDARETKLKKEFRGWGEHNKFVLKANYIDHSHARNIVSAKLWGQIVASRSDYNSLPTGLKTSPNNGAIEGFPVKVYNNGTYQGIYTWNIPKEDWLYGVNEDDANQFVLYGQHNTNGTYAETANNFRALWDGVSQSEGQWEVEVGTNSDIVKTALNNVISLCMNADDVTFKNTLNNYLDVQSALDYYIFCYTICALDSLAQNMILVSYDGTKLYCSAYDLDSTFGLWWNGQSFVSTSYRCPEDYQEPYSLLWERIEKLYVEELKARYLELRNSVLSLSNMFTQFERFMDIIGLDLYAEDLSVYSGIPSGSTNNIKQIRNYIRDRLLYVDGEFENIGEEEPDTPDVPEDVTLTSISATYSGGNVEVGTDVNSLSGITVTATYSDGTTANVTDYILSGEIVEGENTITVSYGGLTTTFTVVGFVELVDDGIDYTLNPLENVATYTNSTYDKKTGTVKEVNNEFRTDKFTLQNCMYSLSIKGGTYPAIFIWDENDNFIESIEVDSPLLFKNFTPLPNYKYALKVYNPTVKDDTTFTLMPVDNRETQVDTFSIDLSQYSFGTGGTGAFEISLTEVFAQKGIATSDCDNITTKFKSTNYFTTYLGFSMGFKLPTTNKTEVMFAIWCYSGTDYILSTTSFASLDEANNWLSTNKPTFTFNG